MPLLLKSEKFVVNNHLTHFHFIGTPIKPIFSVKVVLCFDNGSLILIHVNNLFIVLQNKFYIRKKLLFKLLFK